MKSKVVGRAGGDNASPTDWFDSTRWVLWTAKLSFMYPPGEKMTARPFPYVQFSFYCPSLENTSKPAFYLTLCEDFLSQRSSWLTCLSSGGTVLTVPVTPWHRPVLQMRPYLHTWAPLGQGPVQVPLALQKELNFCEVKLLVFSPQVVVGIWRNNIGQYFLIFSHSSIAKFCKIGLHPCYCSLYFSLYQLTCVHLLKKENVFNHHHNCKISTACQKEFTEK